MSSLNGCLTWVVSRGTVLLATRVNRNPILKMIS